MGPIFLVYYFSAFEFSNQSLEIAETLSVIEVLGVCHVTALYFSINIWTIGSDMAMGNAQVC